ncbi:MAG: hypothetical protein ACRDTN_03955 [Mycobacterium sp.]
MIGLLAVAAGGVLAAAFTSTGVADADTFEYSPDLPSFASASPLDLWPLFTFGTGDEDWSILDTTNISLSSTDSIQGYATQATLGPTPLGLVFDHFTITGGDNVAGGLDAGTIYYLGLPALPLADEIILGGPVVNLMDVVITPLGAIDIPL